MAITLPYPELTAAMESQTRHPLISIVSTQKGEDIPFDGQRLTNQSRNESKPNTLMLSSGRWCSIYTFDAAAPTLPIFRYVYTDENRTLFTFVDIHADGTPDEACLCETAAGNVLIVYRDVSGTNERLRRLVISPIGAVINADALIESFASASYVIQGPYVIRLATGTYLLVYVKKTVSGSIYQIMKRTSTAGLTWSSESALSISGITSAEPVEDPQLRQIITGDIYLSFSHRDSVSGTQELWNCYQSVSADNGGTWGTAANRTNYATYAIVGKHPFMVQKQANQMHFAYTEQRGALNMNHTTSGYCGGTDALAPVQLTFDPATGKLYSVCGVRYGGGGLKGVLKVDETDWAIDNCWNCSTVPAFWSDLCNDAICGVGQDYDHGERFLIPVSCSSTDIAPHVSVLNAEADVITRYVFKTGVLGGFTLTQNVNFDVTGDWASSVTIFGTWVDYNSRRLYVLLKNGYTATCHLRIGWIDLNQTISGDGKYTWTQIVEDSAWAYSETEDLKFMVLPAQDFIVVGGWGDPGRLKVYQLSSGGVYKNYAVGTFPSFPYHGVFRMGYSNGKIFVSIRYYASQTDYRGLCIINLSNDNITYSRPTWGGTIDEYYLNNIAVASDSVLFITTYGYGITSYNPATGIWTEPWTNTTLPGLMPGCLNDTYGAIAIDNATGLIFVGCTGGIGNNPEGLSAFSRYGFIRQTHYMVGTYASGWTFTAPVPLVLGYNDSDMVMGLDSDKNIYALWVNQLIAQLSLKWDKENSTLELAPYIVRGQPITDERDLAKPNNLTFTLAKGNMFDPHNSRSLWSTYTKPGRMLTLRYGEKVGGVDYWTDGGKFMVIPASDVGYERAVYPNIPIEAEDFRHFWATGNDNTTDAYEDTPKPVLEDALQDLAGLELTDMDVPIFDNSVVIYPQWVQTTIQQIVDDIGNRMLYFPMVTNSNLFTMRKIAKNNTVDHTYADLTKIKNFHYNSKDGDMTTRIRIEGEGHDFIEVLFVEERIKSLSGTIGWWGGTKKYFVPYSDDETRTCRFPRLKVIETTKSIAFQMMGSVDEGISFVDPAEHYCIVEISAPNLIPLLIASLAFLAGTYFVPDLVEALGFIENVGFTIRIGTFFTALAMMIISMILGSVVNFQFEVWAQPIGYERQSFSAESGPDLALEALMGLPNPNVVTTKDPLCYAEDQCKFVADNGIMLKMLQRNAASFEMMTDLRREIGDTITIPHPESGEAMTFLIPHFRRTTTIPEGQMNDLSQKDEFDAWRVDNL